MIFNALYILTGSLALSTAAPLEPRAKTLTADDLIAIDSCTQTCDASTQQGHIEECRDAAHAIGPINKSFQQYGLNTPGEQAAAIAWMMFEGDGFKYFHNLQASAVGQGTRNQQSAANNAKYAQYLAQNNLLQGGATGVQQATAAGPAAVLNLLYPDDLSFGSAAWFIATQSAACRDGLKAGTLEGWHTFLTACVNTSLGTRDVLWNKAIAQIKK